MFTKIKIGNIIAKVEDFIRYCPICKHSMLRPYPTTVPDWFHCRYCKIEIVVSVTGGEAVRG